VIQVLEGIEFSQNLTENEQLNRQLVQLNKDLNNFVIEMAVKNPDLVDVGFLINYIKKFTNIQNSDFKLPFNQRIRIFELFENKIKGQEIEKVINREKVIYDFIHNAKVFGNLMPYSLELAINIFLTSKNFTPNYQVIQDARNCILRRSKTEKTKPDEMLDKIIDKLKDFNPSSQGVISQMLLAVSEFPQSEKRDLLLQDLL
jgi:hypothetical protein